MRAEEREVRELAIRLVGESVGHVELAVTATRLAEVATRVARIEVMAARRQGTTWAAIAEAFGIATQTAHERFRSGPDGLHSRFDLRRRPKRPTTTDREARRL